MVNKLLFRSFIVVNTSLGIYGFSRGYRAETKYEKESNYNKLISERLLNGCLNSIFYTIPPWNVYYITKLLNRIEIEHKKLDKDIYEKEYEELIGECKVTL
jgi:hypothetical protein